MKLFLDRLLLITLIVGLISFSIWFPMHWKPTGGGGITPEKVRQWAAERAAERLRVRSFD
jgi:hypothetical protein